MRLRPLTCALALGLLSARSLLAAGVELEVAEQCKRVDRAQLRRLLEIEQQRDAGVQQARVSVSCEGDLVRLRVEHRHDGSSPRARRFAAADVAGEVGARVLSLSAIELLNDRAQPPPEPPPEPEGPLALSVVRAPAPSVRLMALGTLQSFGGQSPLTGAGLAVDYLRLAKLGLRLQFDVAISERSYDLGSAQLQLTTLSAQAGYLALEEAWLVRAFVGYRFGSGRISGKSASGVGAPVGTVAGASGGPLVSAGLGLRSGSWVAELGAEAGLVSFPLEGRVAGHAPIALDDYWLGLNLNVGALL